MNLGRAGSPSRIDLRSQDGLYLLSALVAILAGYFIVTGAWVVLPVLAVLGALGLDGLLRAQPAGRLRRLPDAAMPIVTPVAATLGAALFFRWVSTGYWGIPGAFCTGLLFLASGTAARAADRPQADPAAIARTLLVAVACAGFFGFVAVFYSFDLAPVAAATLCGLAAAVFSVEVFRDAELSRADLAVFSVAAGVAVAQVRWAAAYVRIDGLLAALLLLVLFYAGTGLTLAAASHRLTRRVIAEFGIATASGVIVVIAGRLLVNG